MGRLTNRERGILAICKLNKIFPPRYEINKQILIGKFDIRIEKRSKNNLWGRFGGGWNWVLGIEVGKTTIIINWLIGQIIIRKRRE